MYFHFHYATTSTLNVAIQPRIGLTKQLTDPTYPTPTSIIAFSTTTPILYPILLSLDKFFAQPSNILIQVFPHNPFASTPAINPLDSPLTIF